MAVILCIYLNLHLPKNVQIQRQSPRVLIEKFILPWWLWQIFLVSMCWIEINLFLIRVWASLVAQMVKNPPAMQGTWVQSLDWEDSLEKGMVSHYSSLAWRIPWTEEPGRLQSMGSQRIRHGWVINTFTFLLEYRMSEIGYHCEKYGLVTMNTRNGLPLV